MINNSSNTTFPVAECEQIHSSKSPILTAGDVTPKVLQSFELACLDYFTEKNVPEGEQVRKILGCFHDNRIRDWVRGDCLHLLRLTFDDFMVELREGYLASDWVNTICLELLSLTLAACPVGSTFWDYFNHMQSLNSLLINTTSFQKEKYFRQKVEAGLDAELTQKCWDKGCQDIAALRAWA